MSTFSLGDSCVTPRDIAMRCSASGEREQGTSRSSERVKNCETCSNASRPQLPNQSTTQRLNRAGDVAARSRNSPLAGFIVKTTWRLRWTRAVNQRKSSSEVSRIRPLFCASSRQEAMSESISSPSYSPGTSPLASSAFMRSRNPVDKMFDSSKMKQMGRPSTPATRITLRRSSSKLSSE